MAGRIRYLDSMRAIAILAVVAIHSRAAVSFADAGLAQIVDFIIYPVAVPVFFLVDGYLLAKKYASSDSFHYSEFVGKSFARLVIPWVAFTILYTLARWGFEMVGFLEDRQVMGAGLPRILLAAYGSVYAPQLYFLLSLFILRLMAPVWIWMFRWERLPLLLAFLGFLVLYKLGINQLVPYLEIKGGQEPVLHALWGMQFFFLGGVVQAWKPLQRKRTLLVLAALFAGSVILTFQGRIGSLHMLVQYQYLITFFSFFAAFNIKAPLLDRLGTNTMGIYLLHAPILIKGSSMILQRLVHEPLQLFLSIVALSTLLAYIMTAYLRKSALTVWLLGE